MGLFQPGGPGLADVAGEGGGAPSWIARHPQDSELAYFGGVLANRMGRYDVAVQRLTRCVQAEPQRAKAQAALGLAYEQLGRFADDAIRSFSLAVRADPRFPDARNGLGVALYRAGRLEEAVSTFDAAIALDPKAVEARMNRCALRPCASWAQLAGRGGSNLAQEGALEPGAGRDDVRRMCALGLLESGDRAGGDHEPCAEHPRAHAAGCCGERGASWRSPSRPTVASRRGVLAEIEARPRRQRPARARGPQRTRHGRSMRLGRLGRSAAPLSTRPKRARPSSSETT